MRTCICDKEGGSGGNEAVGGIWEVSATPKAGEGDRLAATAALSSS